MRRKDRECLDQNQIRKILDRAEVIYMAMSDIDWPYCLPFNFARDGEKLYIHSALNGKKLDIISRAPHVAFATALDVSIDTVDSTTYYRSVAGRGIAIIVEDAAEKGRALDLIARKYQAACKQPAPERDIRRVAIIRVDIVELACKVNTPGGDAAA